MKWTRIRWQRAHRLLLIGGIANLVQLTIWAPLAIYVIGMDLNLYVYGTFALCYLISIGALLKQYLIFSRALLVTSASLHIAYLSLIQFGREAYTHFWVFPFIAGIHMCFHQSEKWATQTVTLSLITIFALTESNIFGIEPITVLPTELLRGSQLYVSFSILFITYLIFRVYVDQITKAEIGLAEANAETSKILHNVLPTQIVERIIDGEEEISDIYQQATVVFCDLVGFTDWSNSRDADQVISTLNTIFSRWDNLAANLGLEKIKTIGDAYMVAAGVPTPRQDHAEAAIDFGIYVINSLKFMEKDIGRFEVRIGIHSGLLNAGVIGKSKFLYDIWGETVNTASRMESHGMPGKIQITKSTYELIHQKFSCQPRGVVEIKGLGPTETWWIEP